MLIAEATPYTIHQKKTTTDKPTCSHQNSNPRFHQLSSSRSQQIQAIDMSNNYSLLSIMLNTTKLVMDFLSERDNRVVNVTYVCTNYNAVSLP